MTYPTLVFVPLQADTQGKHRGFEKGPGKYFLGAAEAAAVCADLSAHTQYESVQCVIMSLEEYEKMVGLLPKI